MRGLVVSYDGKVLARRFHKFFNLGEVEVNSNGDLVHGAFPVIVDEEEEVCIADNFENPGPQQAMILEKMDGTLVSPIIQSVAPGPTILWLSRQSRIDEVNEFACAQERDFGCAYNSFSLYLLERQISPLFEW